jgi:hypothetical protein
VFTGSKKWHEKTMKRNWVNWRILTFESDENSRDLISEASEMK